MSRRNASESKQTDLFSPEEFSPSGTCNRTPVEQVSITDKNAPPVPTAPARNLAAETAKGTGPVRLTGRRRNAGKLPANGNSGPFLNVRHVAARYSVSVATIWRWTKERADFPQPRKLGSGSTRWMLDELAEFEARLSEDR
ncbi:helix-turn-helix transcriptional regulator [Hoeflea sp. Naph1]|uniref:helix-turn-helix transcriptional regulator n=1 Tax=Hoeflea sp. Naph1 TaxID=3388653 RepID=UPI00398FFB66